MRIISVNLNGIRAAARKGFFTWLLRQRADLVCLQETKAQIDQLFDPVFHPVGYHCFYHDAKKKGYSGVAIYSKVEPKKVIRGAKISFSESEEGRFIQVDFADFSLISLYLPSGTSGDQRQQIKYQWMDFLAAELQAMRRKRREFIICGDWNIAHKKIDIKNWRSNQKNSGFLLEEREWLSYVLDELGFVDAFRQVNDQPDQYTWWSNRGQAWANNVGWRIDYQMVTPGLRERVVNARIYKEQRFSDHAPLIIDYDVVL